jgi:hypothetical protein
MYVCPHWIPITASGNDVPSRPSNGNHLLIGGDGSALWRRGGLFHQLC